MANRIGHSVACGDLAGNAKSSRESDKRGTSANPANFLIPTGTKLRARASVANFRLADTPPAIRRQGCSHSQSWAVALTTLLSFACNLRDGKLYRYGMPRLRPLPSVSRLP